MKLNKKFWKTNNGTAFKAFSYDDAKFADKFSQQYGGLVTDTIELPDFYKDLATVDSEIYSVILNPYAKLKTENTVSDPNRFKVMIYGPDGWFEYDLGYKTLREANNVVKIASRYYEHTCVVRRRFLG